MTKDDGKGDGLLPAKLIEAGVVPSTRINIGGSTLTRRAARHVDRG
jgi:hypothetical protein